MRKTLARGLIVVTALTGLSFGSAPTAMAHHQGRHHCRANPHTHSDEFYENKNHPKRARRHHKHHDHECAYPPSAPSYTLAARRGI